MTISKTLLLLSGALFSISNFLPAAYGTMVRSGNDVYSRSTDIFYGFEFLLAGSFASLNILEIFFNGGVFYKHSYWVWIVWFANPLFLYVFLSVLTSQSSQKHFRNYFFISFLAVCLSLSYLLFLDREYRAYRSYGFAITVTSGYLTWSFSLFLPSLSVYLSAIVPKQS